jgi:hypothetical protein
MNPGLLIRSAPGWKPPHPRGDSKCRRGIHSPAGDEPLFFHRGRKLPLLSPNVEARGEASIAPGPPAARTALTAMTTAGPSPPLVTSETIGDPFVTWHDGFYYLTGTFDARTLRVWKSPDADRPRLRGKKRIVWTAHRPGPQSDSGVGARNCTGSTGGGTSTTPPATRETRTTATTCWRARAMTRWGRTLSGPGPPRVGAVRHRRLSARTPDGACTGCTPPPAALWIAPMESPLRAVGPRA